MASHISNKARESPLAGRVHLRQMQEAIVGKGTKVTLQEVPIPSPAAHQVLIKVIYSGSNPKDWKYAEGRPHNSGNDISGIVEAVGDHIVEFKKGDRVAALHEIDTKHGSYAEYAIAWRYTTFHLPSNISFEEGATIPLAAMTAAVALYQRLGLPEPWKPTVEPTPLIVYGASGAVGAFAIKLAQLSNIHPIIAIAGRGQAFVDSIITKSKGDKYINYREGNDAVVSGIRHALKAAGVDGVKYAYDTVSAHNSFQNISKVLEPQGSKIALVLPTADYSEIPESIERSVSMVASVHKAPSEKEAEAGIKTGGKEFGLAFFRLFSRWLQEGWLTAHPYEVIPGGLNGIEMGLRKMKAGENSATKYIFKIGDTE